MNKKLLLTLFTTWFCLMQPVQAQAISWEETWKTVKENKVTALAAAALVAVGYYAYKFYRNIASTEQPKPAYDIPSTSQPAAGLKELLKKKVRFAEPLENIITFEPISEESESEERPVSSISPELEQRLEKPEIMAPVSQEIPQKETAAVIVPQAKPETGVSQPQIPREEQKDRPTEKKKKTVSFAPEEQLKQIKAIEPISEEAKRARYALYELTKYLDLSISEIKNRLQRNQLIKRLIIGEKKQFIVLGPDKPKSVSPKEEEFILTGPQLPSEYEKATDILCNQLVQKFLAIKESTDELTKEHIQITLDLYEQKIKDLMTSAIYLEILFEDPNKTIFEKFESYLKSGFERQNLPLTEAYEIMDFDKNNRITITQDKLYDRYKKLAKQYDISTDERGRKIREAYSILGNAVGKKIYDYYLGAIQQKKPNLMNTLRIPKEDIVHFDLEIAKIVNELNYYLACLSTFKDPYLGKKRKLG